MIRRHVSAALLVRDGFTVRALGSGAQVRCLLDGQPCRPVWKEGGYLILTDLPAGEHLLLLERRGYQRERYQFRAEDGVTAEDSLFLKPGPGYPFPPGTAALELTVLEGAAPAAQPVWLGMSGPSPLKLAQDGAAGTRLRLFCGNPGLLPVPGSFLLTGPEGGELVHLRSLQGETGELDAPPAGSYGRGAELVPVQPFQPDAGGRLRAVFPAGGTLWLACAGHTLRLELEAGERTFTWNCKEES